MQVKGPKIIAGNQGPKESYSQPDVTGSSASRPPPHSSMGDICLHKATVLTEYHCLVETQSPCIFRMFSRIASMAVVMVNFICHLDWAKRCPHSWWNIFLCACACVFVYACEVFLEETGLWISRLDEKMLSPVQVGITQSTEDLQRTRRQSKHEFTLSACAGATIFSCPWTGVLAPRCLDLDRDLHHCVPHPNSWAFGLGLNYTIGLPTSPACRWQIVR